jgi:hypothetical protein
VRTSYCDKQHIFNGLDRNLKELPDIYDRRLAACNKLESAETAVLRIAAKLGSTPTTLPIDPNASTTKPSQDSVIESRSAQKSPHTDTERLTLAEQLVPRDKRPSHRLPVGFIPFGLPCMGEKVDTIEWAREEIRICNELLAKARETIEREESSEPEPDADGKLVGTEVTYPAFNSAFITFHQQIAAHMALQVLSHHEPYRMAGRWGEMSPQDVIWENLGMEPYQQKVCCHPTSSLAILMFAGSASD